MQIIESFSREPVQPKILSEIIISLTGGLNSAAIVGATQESNHGIEMRCWLSRIVHSARPMRAYRPDSLANVEPTEDDLFAAGAVRLIAGRSLEDEHVAPMSTEPFPRAPVPIEEDRRRRWTYPATGRCSVLRPIRRVHILHRFRPGQAFGVFECSRGNPRPARANAARGLNCTIAPSL